MGSDSGFTGFLATWGAILSSVTFGWTLYRDIRDRAKIKFAAQLRCMARRDADGALFLADPRLNIEGMSDALLVAVSDLLQN
jgi:hypothetical protein